MDPYEYFVTTSKTGFCTWYAGAFTLFMHAQGIISRVTEGYRVIINDEGYGNISGLNAHAWPEVYMNGVWKIYEPTPPFSPKMNLVVPEKYNVFLHENYDNEVNEKEVKVSNRDFVFRIIGIVLLVAISFLIIFIICFICCSKEKKLIRTARYYVKYFEKKGIPSPSIIGWEEWKCRIPQFDKPQAIEIANKMIYMLYSQIH